MGSDGEWNKMARFTGRLTLAVTVALSLVEFAAGLPRDKPKVIIHALSSVRRGEGLLLECRINSKISSIKRITWRKSNAKNILSFSHGNGTMEMRTDNWAQNWHSGKSNYFYINSTQLNDTGKYVCTVKISKQKTQVAAKSIVVYIEPERVNITGLEKGWLVAEHKKVDVKCLVHHVRPVPKILWVINGQPINKSPAVTSQFTNELFTVESRLKLPVSRVSDLLRVKCLVTNPVNASDVWRSVEKQVKVYYRPSVVVEPQETITPRKGSSFTLLCVVTDAKPQTINRYVWKKNGKKLKVNGNSYRLLLISLNASRDNGNYTCRAKNEAGNSPPMTEPYILKVHYAPVLQIQGPVHVQEGQSVQFNCSLIGAEPAPYLMVNWKRDGEHVRNISHSQLLVIDNVTASDAGNYSCSRSNIVGQGESPAVALHVDHAPQGQAVISVASGKIIMAGASIRLQCDPPEDKGCPAPTWYEWTVQRQAKSRKTARYNTSDSKWEERTNSVTQSANYSCRVGNRIGGSDLSHWLKITVEAPVYVEEPDKDVATVVTRSSFRINCTASGSNIRGVWWRRDDLNISMDHFKEKRSTVREVGYAYGQTQAMLSSLTWTNHSATCDQLDELTGRYTCTVLGTVGAVNTQVESAAIEVDLQYSAVWNDVRTQEVTAAPGDQDKVLICDVCANPPANYNWTFKGDVLPAGVVSDAHSLTIPVVTQQNFGFYQCVVKNRVAGQQESVVFQVFLIEQGPPHTPENVIVLQGATSRSLQLQWRPGKDGGFPPQWFVLQYKRDNDDHFSVYNDSLPAKDFVTVNVNGLQPNTKYTLRLFARNSRPAGGRTDSSHSQSDHILMEEVTRSAPSIKVYQVTVTNDHMTVEWLYNGIARRRRSTSEPEAVSVVIHYKEEGGMEMIYPPHASALPASDRQARINGTFDVLTPYAVWLTVYEAHLLSHTTDVFQQLPSLDGSVGVWGVVGAVLAGVLLMLLVIFVVVIWRCRRRNPEKDGDVELMPSSSTGSPTGYSKVPQSAPEKTNGTSDPAGEEEVVDVIKKPPRKKRKKATEHALLAPEQLDSSMEDDVKKAKPPRMHKRRQQPAELLQPSEPPEPLYQNSPMLRRTVPETSHKEEPLYDNITPTFPEQSEPLYANVDRTDQEVQPVEEEEGMVYADLTFGSARASQPIVVHQADDSVEYSTIDFSKKAIR